jgi:hypothetical protein
MGRAHGRSGGGIEGNKVAETRAPKQEPQPHAVSVGAVSRLGGMVGPGTPYKNIYNQQAYTTPQGPNHNFEVGPGAGREVMKAGSQAPCRPPTPMGRGRSLFK